MHGLQQMYHRLRNHFGHTQWYIKMMTLKWKLDSVCLEIVLILTQDTCKVRVKCMIGSDIIFHAPDGTVGAGPMGYPTRKGEDLV